MTYGEYLRYCRKLAGMEKKTDLTKTDFARLLGLLDVDHYIGCENDKPTKQPSLDLLERAAKAVNLEFSDFIQEPKPRKLTRENEQMLRQLQELLEDAKGQIAADLAKQVRAYFKTGIETFHTRVFRRR